MQTTLKKLSASRIQLTVIIDDVVVKQAEEDVVAAFGKSIEIKGFRKGQAPKGKIREQIAPQKLQEEVVRHLMPSVMKEAIETHKLLPIIRPNVELSALLPMTLTIIIVEKPEVRVYPKKMKLPQDAISASKEKKDQSKKNDEHLLLDLIAEHTKVDLAPELVDDELRDLVSQHAERLKQISVDLDQWLQQKGKSIEDFFKEMRPDAEKRLKIRFGIGSLIDEWTIDVSDEEMEQAVFDLLQPLSGAEKEQLSVLYKKGERAYEQFRFQKKVEKVMEKLKE
jgi:FKBP-type peptidyl-prolyl cis-trans isomerase (trigger factor)